MKKTFLSLFLALVILNVAAQEKYALLFSNLPVVKGEQKEIARNDMTIIKDALLLQGFKTENITHDTTECTKPKFAASVNEIVGNIEKG
jgi:hypothetical protein